MGQNPSGRPSDRAAYIPSSHFPGDVLFAQVNSRNTGIPSTSTAARISLKTAELKATT